MKSIHRIAAIAVTALTLCAAPAKAEMWMSAGAAPDSDGGGTSLAVGGRGTGNWGFELGIVFNSQFSKDLLDYPVPHNSYTRLGTKRTGNSIGLDALYFFNTEAKFSPYAGIGIYASPRKEIAQSTVTGWYYTQSDQTTALVGASVGIKLATDSGYSFGVGYHSIRGAGISIGKLF